MLTLLCHVVCAVTESNRVGVLWRLLQASAFVSQKRRDRLVTRLQRALQATDGVQLLQRLLALHTGTDSTLAAAGQQQDEAAPVETGAQSKAQSTASPPALPPAGVSYFGSLLLQSLLSLPLSDTSLSAALVSLPSVELSRLACDGSGGPVLECVLRVHGGGSFSHPLSTQQRLIDALLPRVSACAVHPSGSYVVERMYQAADVQRKRSIAEALAKDEKRLQHSKPAAMLLRRCRVRQLKTSHKVSALPHTHTASYSSRAAIPATWSSAFHRSSMPMAA